MAIQSINNLFRTFRIGLFRKPLASETNDVTHLAVVVTHLGSNVKHTS